MKAKVLCTATLLLCSFPRSAWAQDDNPGEFPSSEPKADAYPETPSTTAPDSGSTRENNPESGVFGKSDYEEDVRPNPDALGSEEASFQFGPTLQVGFPHPLTYGIEAMYKKYVSFGFSLGSYKLKQDPAEINIVSSDLHARWHPLAGDFFLGAHYGKQKISGEARDDIKITVNGFQQTVPAEISMDIDSGYVTPHFGWFTVYYTGLVLGFELGAQIPLNPSSDVHLESNTLTADQKTAVEATEDYKDLKKKTEDLAKQLSKKAIPYITLFRIGYFF